MWRLWVGQNSTCESEYRLKACCSLDLTAASRVHLLEPQWNPSLEDQALARAHRLGQTRPVTTVKYIMRNSFEEVQVLTLIEGHELTLSQHILQIQERKKHLTTTLLSGSSAVKVRYLQADTPWTTETNLFIRKELTEAASRKAK